MHPSQVLTMGLTAAANHMDISHLTSKSTTSATTNTATVSSTSSVTTATAHLVSNSTVWVTTTLSATTQFVAATAAPNTTVAPSTSWVTATADATTTTVDWTMYPAVPITLTTSLSSLPVSSPSLMPAALPPQSTRPKYEGPPNSPQSLRPKYEGPTCNSEQNWPNSTRHNEVDAEFQASAAEEFCDRHAKHHVKPKDTRGWSTEKKDSNGVHYNYGARWEIGCLEFGPQNFALPLGDDGPSCKDALVSINTDCDNHSVGGEFRVGCVIYDFMGGKNPGYIAPPPDSGTE